jgi:hypothetical protein
MNQPKQGQKSLITFETIAPPLILEPGGQRSLFYLPADRIRPVREIAFASK